MTSLHQRLPTFCLQDSFVQTTLLIQWEADEVQSVCKALIHEHNPRLLLFSAGLGQPWGLQFLTLPQPLRHFAELHLTSGYQSDSDVLNGRENCFLNPEMEKACHVGYLSFGNVRKQGLFLLCGTVSKYTLHAFHISMLHFLHRAVDGRSQSKNFTAVFVEGNNLIRLLFVRFSCLI